MNRREMLAGIACSMAAATLPNGANAAGARSIIVPDIMRCGMVERTVAENTVTLRYAHMMRWDVDTGAVALARSDSEIYRGWLARDPYYAALPIPPHIRFGGAVVAIKGGDPTFKAKWEARTIAALHGDGPA